MDCYSAVKDISISPTVNMVLIVVTVVVVVVVIIIIARGYSRGSIPGRCKRLFFTPEHPDRAQAHQVYCPMGIGGVFPRG
jgi:hypothetical protein